MTPHEVDISWQALRDIARAWAGQAAELDSVTPMAGGNISTTLALTLKDGARAVLKITPHRVDRSYPDEAFQLRLLCGAGLPVPQIYRVHVGTLESPFSYLLMEFVEGHDLAQTRAACSSAEFEGVQRELARLLLQLHGVTHSHYQRAVEQGAETHERWAPCFRQLFDPIWHDVEKSNALPVKTRKLIGRLHERLERLIGHDDCPRLLHWDLWASNLLCRRDADGSWRIAAFLDPRCRYGHFEAEIAYLELFQTATPTFLKAYQQERKLSPEYHAVRKPVYQLYSMLNDLHLFGQEYLKPTLAAAERVARLV